MKNLWRALALAWLGGTGSPALTEEPAVVEAGEERPAEAAQLGSHLEMFEIDGAAQARRARPLADR